MDDELTLALARMDVLAYVESHNADRESVKEYMLTCPVCGLHKLTVNVRSGQWRCFRCEGDGGKGGLFRLVQWLEQLTPRETAQRIIAMGQNSRTIEGPLPEMRLRNDTASPRPRPQGLPPGAVEITQQLPYMARRGITLEAARAFGMRYVPPNHGYLSNRLVFPVWEQGICLYWQARACWDESEHVQRWPGDKFKKSLNPVRERDGQVFMGSSDVVGNLENARRFPRIAIVEGPTSGVATGLDAVWTFGKVLSPPQIARLISAGIRAVDFMWDGPSPKEPHGAYSAMVAAAAHLAPHMDVRLVFLPQGDPANYSPQQVAEFRRNARPFQALSQAL